MNIVKYYNNVLKIYAYQNISEYEVLRFINTTMRNYNIFLNQIKKELINNSVNFNEDEVNLALKKLINQKVAYFNDIKKPVQESKINNNMKRRILSVKEFNSINESVGLNSFEKELTWISNLQAKSLDSKELDMELNKVLKSSEDGAKLYIKSIALDYAGLTKWTDKYKAKAEELGFEIKNNEQPNDIKRLKSGNTFDKPGIKQRHINMGDNGIGKLSNALKEGKSSLASEVINLYHKIYDKDNNKINKKKLNSLIPENLLDNDKLNYDGMFKKMKDEDLTKVKNYLKSLTKSIKESKDDLIDFVIPTWALTYIVNNDPSSLNDEEIEKVDKFIDRLVRLYGNGNLMLGDSEGEDNLGFNYRNDIDNLFTECERMYLKPTK